MSKKTERAIARFVSRAHLVFEAHLLMGMDFKPDPTIPTAATDCLSTVLYNPDFFESLRTKEVCGVIAHEVWHKARSHRSRSNTRPNHQLWNICADFECNADVMHAGHSEFELPGRAVDIDEFEQHLKDMIKSGDPKNGTGEPIHFYDKRMADTTFTTAEQLYDRFEKYIPQLQQMAAASAAAGVGESGGTLLDDDVFNGDYDQSLEQETLEKAKADGKTESQMNIEALQDVARAAERSEKAGHGTSSQALAASLAANATVDWRRVLRRFVTTSYARNDFSFRRQNRQAITQRLILPTLHSEEAGTFVVAIDTSGSCVRALPQFGAECVDIFRRLKPAELIVIYVDSDIAHIDRFKHVNQIKFAPHGGMGTSFKAPFRWIEEQGIKPDCLVYLTDMMGDFPDKKPRYPTLWGKVGNASGYDAPFGQTVPISL